MDSKEGESQSSEQLGQQTTELKTYVRKRKKVNLSNQRSITKTPPWIQVLPLFLLLLFMICIYLLPWAKKRDIVLLTLLITLCPIKLPSFKAFLSAISSTKIPGRSPQSSSVEESYDRRNGGSKEERHLGTGHVTKRQTYGWLQVDIYPETQSWWLYRESSYCGERFHTNLWHRLSRDLCSCGQTKLNSIQVILSVAANRSWPLHQLDVKKAFLHGDLHE